MKGVRLLLVALVTACLAGEGCTTKPGYVIENPFRITPDEFHAKTTTIALTRSIALVDLGDMEPVGAEFDSLIEATVRDAGFRVVPARELDEILERAIGQVGELLDPETGQPDTARVQTVHQLVRERLLDSGSDADAVLLPTIELIAVDIDDDTKARWLGTSECVRRAPIRLFGCGSMKWNGRLPALSIFVTILDMDGAVMFRNGGGIQVFATAKISAGRAFANMFAGLPYADVDRVPREKLFVDKERNIAAVKFALALLVGMR